MPSRESDREDLMREATALVERAELKIAGYDEPIVVGFRKDGSASFFFGPDPVYQFNSARELRRAFIGDLLYKAERGRLVALRRERTETEVSLIRSELNSDETTNLLAALHHQLNALCTALSGSSFEVLGQVPTNGDLIRRIRIWLAGLSPTIQVATAPNVR